STISATTDQNTSNNASSNQTTALAAADLDLTLTPSATNVVAGEAYSFSLTSTNHGPNALASDASQTISFTVPVGSSVTSQPAGGSWTCAPSTGYPLASGATINCTLPGALAVNATTSALVVNAVSNIAGTVSAAFAVSAKKGDGTPMEDGDLSNNTRNVSITSSSGSDVAVVKTASPTVVAQNANVTYTLTPRHNGGEQPGGGGGTITVTDTLGANLTFVSASGTGWSCIGPGPTITCTRPGPYTGGNFTNMPAITVVATATALGTLGNTAVIAIPETDPDTNNNTSSINITATNDADLAITKTASLNPVLPGQGFNYILAVRNLGPLALPGGQTVTVTDSLPPGVQLTGQPTGSGWICTPAAGFPLPGAAISCTSTGALGTNANANAITVPVSLIGATTETNTACVALAGAGPVDPDPGLTDDNCAGAAVTASTTQADLQITKVASGTVIAGQDLTYTINVANLDPDTSTNVVVTDALGSLVNTGGLQSITTSLGTCTPAVLPANGTSQTLTCNLGNMVSGANATITVVVRPSIAATGARVNTATVRSPNVGDPNQANNTASASSTVTAIVDLRAGKTATPSSVPAGTPITFIATLINDGPSTAQNARVTDTLPANAILVGSPVASNGGTCTVPPVGTAGGTLVCTWASVPAASQRTATYRMRPLGTAAGQNVVNSVVVSTTTAETTLSNNSATTTTAVTAPDLDIVINKVDSADPINLGQFTTYTITVNNAGPSYGTNVVMTDVFPATGSNPTATFSYQGFLTVDSSGTCSTQPAIGAIGGTLVCAFPGLDSGQTATVTYRMRAESLLVPGATSGTVFNGATVVVNETERTLANNFIQEFTTTNRVAIATDLALTKTAPATAVTAGASLVYTLTVLNNGPLPSDGSQVIDTLPPGATFVSAPGCVNAAGTVMCSVGALGVGASKVFSLTVQLANPYNGARPLTNTATVDAPGDTVPGNNTSTATTPVAANPNVVGVPTLSQWGLIILSALLGLLALGVTRRRNKQQL
ncbi:MAG: sorting protein, partial [Rhodoferax sp.]|nr:sorting protein [Rhodoferax sp.]